MATFLSCSVLRQNECFLFLTVSSVLLNDASVSQPFIVVFYVRSVLFFSASSTHVRTTLQRVNVFPHVSLLACFWCESGGLWLTFGCANDALLATEVFSYPAHSLVIMREKTSTLKRWHLLLNTRGWAVSPRPSAPWLDWSMVAWRS